MSEVAGLRLQVIQHACSSKCMGHAGNAGGCCKLGARDYIIGPVEDAELFLTRLRHHLGRPVTRKEVLIEFEEGRRLFPERSTWQNPRHFPALRVSETDAHACRFHDDRTGCSIHGLRPHLCRNFECDWLRAALDALF
jgi:Fe-S-cluster containining protein